MPWAHVEAAIDPGATLVLDTSAILAYLDGTERVSGLAAGVIDGLVATGRNPAAISALSVSESLVRPMRAGSTGAVAIVETFLAEFPHLQVQPVTYEIAREGASIRARTAMPTPDALILATAVVGRHPVVVANDGRWQAAIERAGLPVRLVHLEAFA